MFTNIRVYFVCGIFKIIVSMRFLGPDFIIVGAQKCGTTSLYHYLAQHPQVVPSKTKEIHYFDLNYDKGDDWYHDFFPARRTRLLQMMKNKKMITGEASPYYIFHPLAIKRIYDYNRKIKIIVLLRNPVERTWSHFRFAKQCEQEQLCFSEALRCEDGRIVGEEEKMLHNEEYQSLNYQHCSYRKRSEYYDQIKRLLEYFNHNNILILKSEDLFSDPQNIMDEVCGFLRIQKISGNYQVRNEGKVKEVIDPEIEHELRDHFRPYNEKLYQIIGRNFNW